MTNVVLRALAEPKRVAILRLIRSHEMRAGDIARNFRTTRPAVSQHLRVLVDAGLVSERREGTSRLYAIRREGFAQLRSFFDSFWDEKLVTLKDAVERDRQRD